MSSETKTVPVTTAPRQLTVVVATYTAAIFLSAALLFAVQPMFTKIVLPRFGGSPSVWAVAMVFFQGILLFGYAYADALTRFAGRRLALPIHLGVMMGGAMFLPLSIADGWGMPTPGREEMFLLGLFAVSIGFPFFALSANGPLLQAWFARSGHPGCAESLLSLCGQQCRQPAGAVRLSGDRRAAVDAELSGRASGATATIC